MSKKKSGKKQTAIKAAAFEAGQTYQPNRAYIYIPTLPEKELSQYNREEILRKARWLYNNLGFAARAIDGPVRYAVGGGLIPQARTQDREWNNRAEQLFEDTCGTNALAFDVGRQFNFYDAQRILLRSMALDGDVFLQLRKSAEGRAMVQIVAAHQCATPKDDARDARWRDGVRVADTTGAATAYAFTNGTLEKVIQADDVIHLAHHKRLGFSRGVSWLARAAAHLQDMSEITAFTKSSFKLGAQLAFVMESQEPLRLGVPQTGGGADSTESMQQGSVIAKLKPGEKITPIKSEHPSSSFTPMMDFLARDIAWGVGVAPEVLWDITNASGANSRLALADAQTFFEELQQLLVNTFCRRFWRYWAWGEIEAGRLPNPGPDWFRVDFVPPRKATVDFGRDTRALWEIVKSGGMSLRRFAEMNGWDCEAEDAAIVEQWLRRKRMAEQAGLDASLVFGQPVGGAQ